MRRQVAEKKCSLNLGTQKEGMGLENVLQVKLTSQHKEIQRRQSCSHWRHQTSAWRRGDAGQWLPLSWISPLT